MSEAFALNVERATIIHWRLRRDIQWTALDTSGTAAWIATDPMTRKNFHIGAEEKFLLQKLDGNCDIGQLRQQFAAKFSPKTIDEVTILQLISLAMHRGLLVGAQRDRPVTFSGQLSGLIGHYLRFPYSLIFTRFSFGNPERMLRRLRNCEPIFFSGQAVLFWSMLMLVSFALLLSRWTHFVESVPSWQTLASPRTLLGFGAAFVFTRIIHELGHALACRAFGARCPDSGLFLMMGMACPYVDVSDSCRLPNRWHRASIAAAGVYAEFILASIAAWIWIMTYEGWLHTFSWQILIVSSISTLLFNCNPLMRYDGYFVLCDLLGITNLRETATQAMQRFFARWLFGATTHSVNNGKQLNREAGFILFGSASGVYRLVMVAFLCFAVWSVLDRWELSWLGTVLVSTIVIGLVAMPLGKSIRWTLHELRAGRLRPVRTALGWIALTVLVGIMLFMPIPQRLSCIGQVFPADESTLYTTTDGIIQSSLSDRGSHASEYVEGETIIALRNPAVEVAVLDAESHRSAIFGQVSATRRLAFSKPLAGDQIPKLESALESAERELEHARRRQSQLQIAAAKPGRLISARAPEPNSVKLFSSSTLNQPTAAWNEAPVQGRQVPVGTVVGWVQHSEKWLVRGRINETQLPRIHQGLPVHIRLAQDPWRVYYGTVQRIAFQPNARPETATSPQPASQSSDETTQPTSQYMLETSIEVPAGTNLVRAGNVELVIHSHSLPMAKLISNWLWRNLRIR
jgi:putative peptide zinc metalloprotease protein